MIPLLLRLMLAGIGFERTIADVLVTILDFLWRILA